MKKILKFFFYNLIIILLIGYLYTFNISNKETKIMYLASSTNEVKVYTLSNNIRNEKTLLESKKLPRGTKIKIIKNNKITIKGKNYHLIKLNNNNYYIEDINLSKNYNEVVLENKIYIKAATSILKEDNSILGLAKKGEEFKVLGFDYLNKDGTVNKYTIEKEFEIGKIYGQYTAYTKEEALANYMASIYDPIHSKVKNPYGGGEAIELDFYPNEKPNFKNNTMPTSVYSLYLNCHKSTIDNIDSYIEFAKTTNINAFVIDIKDNEAPAYPAKIFKTLSPTNYKKAINSYDGYKEAIRKLKEANFYVIGRITTFKDNYFVKDNQEVAILDKNTNKPYLHNGSYWPSPYNRDVWYFNVELAKEAVEEFGFNEINFDYVRFPDKMNKVDDIIDLKNTYNESKVQAIQRFISYARDSLHELNTYISIDVFGETTNSTYTTAYGQYWPAISNVSDVICAMPYPDHFVSGSYGLKKPWNEPYKLMYYWGLAANDRQKETTTKAKVRTWIQAYDVMKYVDKNGIKYNDKEIEAQIRGLYDANIMDGYITWLSNSNLEKYKSQANAFKIDYRKEYLEKNE